VISLVTHDSARQILRRTLNLPFAAVFGYFALAGALSASLVYNGIAGMVQTLCLFVLGMPVADSVGGRRIRSFLESQLMSVDQQVQYGELARGTIHNVRNSIAVALATLDDLGTLAGPKESSALAAIKLSLEEARQALGDAVSSPAASNLTFSRVELGEQLRLGTETSPLAGGQDWLVTQSEVVPVVAVIADVLAQRAGPIGRKKVGRLTGIRRCREPVGHHDQAIERVIGRVVIEKRIDRGPAVERGHHEWFRAGARLAVAGQLCRRRG